MSRPKGSGKLEWGKDARRELLQAAWGADHGWSAWVRSWRTIFEITSKSKSPVNLWADIPQPAKGTAFVLGEVGPIEYFIKRQLNDFASIMALAIKKRDGSAFRKIADAVELLDGFAVSPVKEYLLSRLFHCVSGKQIVFLTIRQMREELLARKFVNQIDESDIRKHCREIGAKWKLAKVGRPRN